jgi:hypothetical protein
MSTEIFGLFDNNETAKAAEKALLEAGFSHGEIEVKRDNQSFEGKKLDGLDDGQRLLVVTAVDDEDYDRATAILQAEGATNLGERVARYHANRLIPDPDYTEGLSTEEHPIAGFV